MRARGTKREAFEALDKQARDMSDVRPMTPAMRRQWEAARRTGIARRTARTGQIRKGSERESRIVPISMDPALLEAVDRCASSAGVTRSRFIAEALRLRMGT